MFRENILKERFDVYYPMLCRIAFGYIPDPHECEDIVQECFIAVWNNGRDSLDEREFVMYMVRAVKNRCISFLRKQRQNVVSIDDSPNVHVISDATEGDDDTPTPEEKLDNILSVLPPKCKEIFLLSKYNGLKYTEIAIKMDISVKTVENQMGKALRLIREQIKAGNISYMLLLFLMMIKK